MEMALRTLGQKKKEVKIVQFQLKQSTLQNEEKNRLLGKEKKLEYEAKHSCDTMKDLLKS